VRGMRSGSWKKKGKGWEMVSMSLNQYLGSVHRKVVMR